MIVRTENAGAQVQATWDGSQWTIRTFRSFNEMLAQLDSLIAQLEELGYADRELFGVRLALEEAMVNALKHGHKGDDSREVVLRYRLCAQSIMAEVEDQGSGFNPDAVPDPRAPENLQRPSGRGLLLMRRYMSWVRHNPRGNRVTLCRYRGS
jgi:serine/threonine-protein kinase RsbW